MDRDRRRDISPRSRGRETGARLFSTIRGARGPHPREGSGTLRMSMQVVEKSADGLSRVWGVTVPAKDLADKLEARIAEITPTLRIKGFRPGKVPTAHVRRLYGKCLMSEVLEQTLSETTQKVLDENKVRDLGLELGFVDVKVAAIDGTWSGLKFVRRLRDR